MKKSVRAACVARPVRHLCDPTLAIPRSTTPRGSFPLGGVQGGHTLGGDELLLVLGRGDELRALRRDSDLLRLLLLLLLLLRPLLPLFLWFRMDM